MMITERCRVWCAICLLLLCLGFGPAKTAQAKVHINGHVQLWRPDLNQYTPLKRVRVRMVLAEDYDSDTGDVETTCNDNGDYAISKGNPWWRKNYKAYPIVFAEVPDRLEIQDSYPQIDGYQAATGHVLAHQNKTTVINVNIGGPQSNVNYHVGGWSGIDNTSTTSVESGLRAFYLCDVATDHRLRMTNHGFGTWEEKEIIYPNNDGGTAAYMSFWDYIRVPEGNFNPSEGMTGLMRVSSSIRHEMSHGIMADTYWTWPGVFDSGSAGSHTLDKKAERREYAWSEAWAEFIGSVSQQEVWGSTRFDLETQNAPWHKLALTHGDASYIEGEIIASMWDMQDGVGTEECLEQNPDVPGTETFVDRMSGGLDKIRTIFQNEHPHSFTHESFLGSSDSLIWYWMNKEKYGQPHELKTILFNRGIRVNEIAQTAPIVSMGVPTWNKFDLQIPYRVVENDAEDRPFVTVKIYAGDTLIGSRTLTDGWKGFANSGTFALSYGVKKGAPTPKFMLAVSDEMQTVAASLAITPPANAMVEGVSVQFVKLEVLPPFSDNTYRQVKDLRLLLHAVQNGKNQVLPIPGKEFVSPAGSDGIQFIGSQSWVYNKSAELLRTMQLDKPIQTFVDVKASVFDQGKPLAFEGTVALANLSAATGYSIGTNTYVVELRKNKSASVGSANWANQIFGGQDKSLTLSMLLTLRVEPITSLNAPIDFSKIFVPQSFFVNLIPLDNSSKAPPEPAPGTPKAPPQTPAAAMSRANSVIKTGRALAGRGQQHQQRVGMENVVARFGQSRSRGPGCAHAARFVADESARKCENSPVDYRGAG